MIRRTFLTLALAGLPFATTAWAGDRATTLDYTPGLIAERLAAGEVLFVDYATDWCTTCKAQERQIGQLRGDNPAYNEHITFVRVDYDDYGRHEVSTSRNIPRRSTLIVLSGDEELGRIVASANGPQIKELMDKALKAATKGDS